MSRAERLLDRKDNSVSHPGKEALSWLRSLAKLLDESTCRYQGDPISLDRGLNALLQIWSRQIVRDRSVFWIGNGGSAALVSHLSQDLINQCGVRSQTFNDPSLITCMSNDYGYEQVFKRPLRALARERDVLMAVSSSGMSANIVDAARTALEIGMDLVTFSAFSADNRLHKLQSTLSFHTPTDIYGHAELAHAALIHAAVDICSRWEEER